MEVNIADQLRSLHVINSYDFSNMEELVQDLASALEESSRARSSEMAVDHITKRQNRKRRGNRRRNNTNSMLTEYGNISEPPRSSNDEALQDYIDNIMLHSDSDDIVAGKRLSALSIPITAVLSNVSLHESDSLTETLTPIRHRRRRKFKQMLVDPETDTDNLQPHKKPRHKRLKSKLQIKNSSDDSPAGKIIKRYVGDIEMLEDGENIVSAQNHGMECPEDNQESSALSSSEDTDDGVFTFDEGQEGDDEQSDFFHEPGPACGIPGIIPWWEREKPKKVDHDPVFENILTGCFEHMPRASQSSFKARISRLSNKQYAREFLPGRRRLKGRTSRSRNKGSLSKQSMRQAAGSFTQSGEIKRRRKTPPLCGATTSQEGYVGEDAEPLAETNIGHRMLESMGWSPGTGLGPDNSGIKTPIVAYMRPRRQGLGHNVQADKTEVRQEQGKGS